MIIEFDRSFIKSLDKIRDKVILSKVEKVIINLEKAKSLVEIPNLKKLVGYKTYYRIRIGDYRLGLEKIDDNTLRLIILANRKNIYKAFP